MYEYIIQYPLILSIHMVTIPFISSPLNHFRKWILKQILLALLIVNKSEEKVIKFSNIFFQSMANLGISPNSLALRSIHPLDYSVVN